MSKNNSLKKASIKQLEQALNARKNSRITELKQEMSVLEKEIIELRGTGKSASVVETIPSNKKVTRVRKSMAKTRATNEKSLKDMLVNIGEDGNAHTTNEYLAALQAAGWKSSSPKPYNVVAAALASQEKKNVFRRVSKGLYALVKGE